MEPGTNMLPTRVGLEDTPEHTLKHFVPEEVGRNMRALVAPGATPAARKKESSVEGYWEP
eukprot:1159062-Pelagomonas_calceolata.AAC.2